MLGFLWGCSGVLWAVLWGSVGSTPHRLIVVSVVPLARLRVHEFSFGVLVPFGCFFLVPFGSLSGSYGYHLGSLRGDCGILWVTIRGLRGWFWGLLGIPWGAKGALGASSGVRVASWVLRV